MKRFNEWLAKRLGDLLGNMYFFYACVILDILELPAVWSAHSAIAWVTYVSQTVIQLLALPVLQVYQNLQNDKHNEVIGHIKKIHKHLGVK